MKTLLAAFFAVFALASLPANAEISIINLSVGGEISPGVYGQVQFGNAPPPQVINAQPMMIVPVPRGEVVEPMYLHVPPGQARRWSRYCHRYNACNRPVYFVKEGRYQPDTRGREDHGDRGTGITGSHIRGINSSGMVAVKDREVTQASPKFTNPHAIE